MPRSRALDRETPLGQRIIAIGFEPFGRGERGFDTERRERGKNGARHRVVDLHGADAETVDAAAIDDVLAGAVIARQMRCGRCSGCAALRPQCPQMASPCSRALPSLTAPPPD